MTTWWEPRTEADLDFAIAEGLLQEGDHLDFKQQPAPPGQNLKTAVDFASFAVDGGRILYGADQPTSNGPITLTPFDTANLAERLANIARSGLIDPPLRIRCVDIESLRHPGQGYLLVVIPPSPDAPHQVKHRYRGRVDRTNVELSDAEVRRVIRERQLADRDIESLLAEEIDRDPTGPELRHHGHLFLVAHPVRGSRALLSRTLDRTTWTPWLRGAFRDRVLNFDAPGQVYPDLFLRAAEISPRPRGWAVHSYNIGPDRAVRPNGDHAATETDLLDCEIHDDGSVHLFCSRASFDWNQRGRYIFENLIVTLTRRFLRAAAAVSEQADFFGQWSLGVALRSIDHGYIDTGMFTSYQTREVPDYAESATVAADQLLTDPDEVARLLLSPFFRGLGRLDGLPGLDFPIA